MAKKWKDPWFEKYRVLEALFIQERIRRRAESRERRDRNQGDRWMIRLLSE
jgi:hypothetical protein